MASDFTFCALFTTKETITKSLTLPWACFKSVGKLNSMIVFYTDFVSCMIQTNSCFNFTLRFTLSSDLESHCISLSVSISSQLQKKWYYPNVISYRWIPRKITLHINIYAHTYMYTHMHIDLYIDVHTFVSYIIWAEYFSGPDILPTFIPHLRKRDICNMTMIIVHIYWEFITHQAQFQIFKI